MADKRQPELINTQIGDDFKLVDGIGPAVEKRLHAAGILTYAQLAHLTSKKLAKLLDGMVGYSPKRIQEKNWSNQAQKLADQYGQAITEEPHEPNNNSLHYASYTVELLLDRDNQVRRTRAMHVQTRQESSWAGWKAGRLQRFLVDSGQLQISSVMETEPAQVSQVTRPAPSSSEIHKTDKPYITLQGATKIVKTRLLNQSGQPLGALIPGKTPFSVELILDLSQVEFPKEERLSYYATIYLKRMGKSRRDISGGTEGSLTRAKRAAIEIYSEPLDPGDYRLEALVALHPHSQPKSLKNQLTAVTEGMFLHVF